MLFKIMKNHGVSFCTETNRPRNEYIIFDCSKQEQTANKLTVLKAIELQQMFGMTCVSPIQALREGLFDYKEVAAVEYPLPFESS
jgi:hypothetical protein